MDFKKYKIIEAVLSFSLLANLILLFFLRIDNSIYLVPAVISLVLLIITAITFSKRMKSLFISLQESRFEKKLNWILGFNAFFIGLFGRDIYKNFSLTSIGSWLLIISFTSTIFILIYLFIIDWKQPLLEKEWFYIRLYFK